MGGLAFQILPRNALACPEIIGINLRASAAAVFGGGSFGPAVQVGAIRVLCWHHGIAAMLQGFIFHTPSQAAALGLHTGPARWVSSQRRSSGRFPARRSWPRRSCRASPAITA